MSPILLLSIVLQVGCAVHVIRTGRPMYWIFLLLIGSYIAVAVYLLAEVMPDMRNSPGARRAMRASFQRELDAVESHLSFLATVGSVAPYIGLFGTVWGIMNSFRGLAQVQQATLATVAPGIAEALIATAIGLFAAIPAVIAYNRFAARGETLVGRYYTFADEFQAILHRKVHTSDE